MQRRFFILALTAVSLLLSCSSPIPEPLNSFLLSFSSSKVSGRVKSASYTYEERMYTKVVAADGTFVNGEQVGVYTQKISLDLTEDQYSYLNEQTWEGETIPEGSDQIFDSRTLTKDKDGDKWTEVTVRKYTDASQDTSETKGGILAGDALSATQIYLFGNTQTNLGGLYYGDFLRSVSKYGWSYMTIGSDDHLVYDPPAQGVSTDTQTYLDLKIEVNDLGLLLERTMSGYDAEKDRMAESQGQATYIYF